MMSATSEDSGSNFGTNDELGLDENGASTTLFGQSSSGAACATTADSDSTVRRIGALPTDGMSDGGSSRTPGSLSFGLCADSMMAGPSALHQISGDGHLAIETDMLGFDTTEEQRYCFCNDVSYGDMIACDGVNCPREWFHYGCVNLVVAPKGSWFCRDCKTKHRQRRA